MKILRFVTLGALAAALAACGEDGDGMGAGGSGGNGGGGSGGGAAEDRLRLELDGLPELGGGFLYEGWTVAGGEARSTGKFAVRGGELVDPGGEPVADFPVAHDANEVELVVISIEPAVDPDPGPADTKLLAGAVSGGAADLTVEAGPALGSDFGDAAGSFILATPTNGPGSDELAGIWFLVPGDAPAASLDLPDLPEGWVYEGWAVIDGTPVSTGRFRDRAAADLAAPFSGPMAGPPFPGEDFLADAPAGLVFPADLPGGMAVISVEPDPDDDQAPFALKPLVGPVPGDAMPMTSYPLAVNPDPLPSARATLVAR